MVGEESRIRSGYMKPLGFIMKDDVAVFRYDTAELKAWLKRGRETGDVVSIVRSIDYKEQIIHSDCYIYKAESSGEHTRYKFHAKNLELFFGKLPTPEAILCPPKKEGK